MIGMTQANVLLATAGHWAVAAQTGLIAGSATAALVLLSRARKPWVVAILLGILTAVVDVWVHPGGFGPVFMEAAVTGLIAGGISFTVGWIRRRSGRQRAGPLAPGVGAVSGTTLS